MRCSNCGKEFGTGTHCQNCGVDRVTGLANYNGYNNSGNSSEYNSPNYDGSPRTTVCYACSEIIPLGATYCPVCGKKLLVTCPNCGHEYSSQYSVCSECGTNRIEYEERKKKEEEEKRAWEQSPEGQAEKTRILHEQMDKENKSVAIFHLVLWVGGVGLLLWLNDLVDKNWLNQVIPIIGGTWRFLILVCISFGVSFLGAVIISGISED